MSDMDTKRVATLTTAAIRATTDDAAKSMMATVDAAEAKIGELQGMIDVVKDKVHEMRGVVEQFIEDFTRATGALTNTVDTHVNSCQAVIDLFQEHHLKILNPNALPPPGTNSGSVNHDRSVDDIIKEMDAAVLRTRETR